MSVIVKDVDMPRVCGECAFMRPKMPYPCWCYAGDFPIKPTETDLRVCICPLEKIAEDEEQEGEQ